MTGPFVPVAMLNLIRALLGIHHHRFNLSVKRSSELKRDLKEPVHAIPPSGLAGLLVDADLADLLQRIRWIAGHGEIGDVTVAMMRKVPAFLAIAPQR